MEFITWKEDLELLRMDTVSISDLMSASKNGNVDLVKGLISDGCDIDETDCNGNTALMFSIVNDRFEIVEYLIDNGANLHAITHTGFNAIWMSCASNSIDMLKCLVNDNISYANISCHKCNLMCIGTYVGNFEIVKYLCDLGVSIGEDTNDGFNSLYIASYMGWIDIVEYLMSKDINWNNVCHGTMHDEMYSNCLLLACIRNNIDIVKLLMGYNIRVSHEQFMEILKFACTFDFNFKMCQYVVDNGMDINEEFNGITTMETAIHYGNIDIIRFLISNNVYLGAQGSLQETSLMLSYRISNVNIIKFLIKHGESIDQIDIYGFSILHNLIKHDNPLMVEHILRFGGQVDIVSKNNVIVKDVTPLMYAIMNGNLEIIIILINYGSNVNKHVLSVNLDWGSPLMIALCIEHNCTFDSNYSMSKMLISNGADINLKVSSLSPLIMCIDWNDINLLNGLMMHGFNEDTLHDLIDYAHHKNRSEIVRYLDIKNSNGDIKFGTNCSICLEDVDVEDMHILKCNHTFHKLCIINSLSHSNRCPNCRFICHGYDSKWYDLSKYKICDKS